MSADDSGSVTHWIGALRGGDLDAAQPLWERYFARLVRLAQARLRTRRGPGVAEDEEDAALSAFDSFRGVPFSIPRRRHHRKRSDLAPGERPARRCR